MLTYVCIFTLPSWETKGQKPQSAVIFRNLRFQKPSLHLRIPNVAKCKWEKVYDAHLGEDRAVSVAQLGLLGTAFALSRLGPVTPQRLGISSLQRHQGFLNWKDTMMAWKSFWFLNGISNPQKWQFRLCNHFRAARWTFWLSTLHIDLSIRHWDSNDGPLWQNLSQGSLEKYWLNIINGSK